MVSPGLGGGDELQCRGVDHLAAVDREHHVALAQPRRVGRAARPDVGHQGAVRAIEAEAAGFSLSTASSSAPSQGRTSVPPPDRRLDHPAHHGRGDREADAGGAAARRG